MGAGISKILNDTTGKSNKRDIEQMQIANIPLSFTSDNLIIANHAKTIAMVEVPGTRSLFDDVNINADTLVLVNTSNTNDKKRKKTSKSNTENNVERNDTIESKAAQQIKKVRSKLYRELKNLEFPVYANVDAIRGLLYDDYVKTKNDLLGFVHSKDHRKEVLATLQNKFVIKPVRYILL